LRGLSHDTRRRAVLGRLSDRNTIRLDPFVQHHAGSRHRDWCLDQRCVYRRPSEGSRSQKAHIYPAMPYTYYAHVNRHDIQSIRLTLQRSRRCATSWRLTRCRSRSTYAP
jgi:hypothetical protein